MITVLVVGPPETNAAEFAEGHPSVEILAADGVDEALEKLARNRRIDAVLLLPGADAPSVAEALREEDPAAPPVFAPASAGSIAGARSLAAEEPLRLLELVVRTLEPGR